MGVPTFHVIQPEVERDNLPVRKQRIVKEPVVAAKDSEKKTGVSTGNNNNNNDEDEDDHTEEVEDIFGFGFVDQKSEDLRDEDSRESIDVPDTQQTGVVEEKMRTEEDRDADGIANLCGSAEGLPETNPGDA